MSHSLSLVFLILIIGFAFYRRVKRTIGFQKLEPRRLIFRTVLFGILGLLILALAIIHPLQLVGDAIGVIGGLTLGYFGIRHLKFEKREQGWFYRTHGTIGAIVLVLFIGRIAYRIVESVLLHPGGLNGTGAGAGAGAAGNPYGDFSRDPLTSAVFLVLVSYYIRFFTYLLRKERHLDGDTEATHSG